MKPPRPPRVIVLAFLLGMTIFLRAVPGSAGITLDKVRSKGILHCGVTESMAGYAFKDGQGRWQGFMVDFCRAVSTAVLGDGERVTFTPLTASARFPALLAGKIDLLAHNTTLTFEREAALGIEFPGIYLYDGQGFLVARNSRFRKVAELKGATVCVEKKTTHEAHLEDTFRVRNIPYTPLVVDSMEGLADLQAG
ncbi:MAG TPA: transporter substrate-binding domain-containing protein, partial [Thermodesulfobacteriota bacterium]|nr:transporter substrate-binding domain-containing protein [Thermodesulfobacteriota bacterium]